MRVGGGGDVEVGLSPTWRRTCSASSPANPPEPHRFLPTAAGGAPSLAYRGQLDSIRHWDEDEITCLRACAMKLEHRQWRSQIVSRLIDALQASGRLRLHPKSLVIRTEPLNGLVEGIADQRAREGHLVREHSATAKPSLKTVPLPAQAPSRPLRAITPGRAVLTSRLINYAPTTRENWAE